MATLTLKSSTGPTPLPDNPIDDNAVSINAGAGSATAILPMLREITERLDRIEKESWEFKKIVYKELDDKLTSLGNALQTRTNETSASIGAINRKIENIVKERETFTENEEEQIPKDGFLRRIFK